MANPERKVAQSFKVNCEGTDTFGSQPLKGDNRPEVIVTIFNNGERQAGCPYLDRTFRYCEAPGVIMGSTDVPCIQLFPQTSNNH